MPRRLPVPVVLSAVAWMLAVTAALAQTVPNANLEVGDPAGPQGWTLVAGSGDWRRVDGDHALVATGDGQSTSFWLSEPVALEAGFLYRLRFRARRLVGDGGGTVMAGPPAASRDLGALGPEWRVYSSHFAAPHGGEPGSRVQPTHRLRFGQWHLDGAVAFDDVRIDPAQAIHRRAGVDLVLGAGESITSGRYTFQMPHEAALGNISRPLWWHDAAFNTNRWVFAVGQSVVFRHRVGGLRQRSAQVFVNVSYRTGGRLLVEARRAGGGEAAWVRLGQVESVRSATFPVAASLLPARALDVRLRGVATEASTTGIDSGSFQVDDYGYRADVEGDPPAARGSTHLLTVVAAAEAVTGRLTAGGALQPGLADTAVLEVRLPRGSPLAAWAATGALEARQRAVVSALGRAAEGGPNDGGWRPVRLAMGTTRLEVPYRITGTGDRTLHLQLEARRRGEVGTDWRPLWHAEIDLEASILHADDYGERLPAGGRVALWWASSGWKVSATRRVPERRGPALRVATAGNEAEAAQLVVRPPRRLRDLTVTPGDLRGPGEARLGAAAIEVLRVGTVPVHRPSDETGQAAAWPDPLLPVDGAVMAAANRNLIFWVRVTPPRGTPAGRYRGALSLRADGWGAEVPLEVEVFGFDLPDRMTCQTAFGLSPSAVWTYHRLENDRQRRRVWARYLDTFSRHHISPYDPAPQDAPVIEWPEGVDRQGGDGRVLEPRIDWAAWDAAMEEALDRRHFNTFRVSIPGLGGGTFLDGRPPELLGYGADTPQYRSLFFGYTGALERHLADKGWLDEAYVYPFDEPAPGDYGLVMDAFGRLRAAAPRLRRLLTEQPEPELLGGPDLWCPLTSRFDPAVARRRLEAGERFWWYVCTVPKAPYPGLFIDHAGTEPRVWLWQTWQRGIDGILVWDTVYWNSRAVYPDRLQDPYADPMSWESTAATPVGRRRPWGNGDGRLLYPPPAAVARGDGPVLDGPVETIRWEMLRDGIEDYEYLAMLARALDAGGDGLDPDRRRAWSALLEVPAAITASATRFTTDPEPMETRRRQIARALEALAR